MTLDELVRTGRNFASVAEVKDIFECDERTVYSGIEGGEIPATRVGSRWKIPVAWLCKVAAVAEADPAPGAEPIVSEQFAAAVADRVVVQLARAFAVLAAQESP